MTNEYITNPSVRKLLAQEIALARQARDRIIQLSPRHSATWQEQYLERVQSYRLFAIATDWAVKRGQLHPAAALTVPA